MRGRKGGPFRVKVKEFHGGISRQTFVVHSDGTRTVIQDAAATAAASHIALDFGEEI